MMQIGAKNQTRSHSIHVSSCLPAVTGDLRVPSETMRPFGGCEKARRPWWVFAFFCLAKPAECFAQFFLTKPESVEEDVFPGAAFSLFQSGSHKLTRPGMKTKA